MNGMTEHTTAAPWRFEVLGHPPSANERLHAIERWRRCRPFKEFVGWQALAVRPPRPLERAHVRATLVYARRPFKDCDNGTSALKPCLDGLILGGLIADDSPDRLSLEVRQVLGERRSVVLEIWPLDDASGRDQIS
jgi:hypothetical protein